MSLDNAIGSLTMEETQQDIRGLLIEAREQAQSPFGDTLFAESRLVNSIKANYGILDDTQTFSATGGSVTASASEFVLQTGTSVGGYGVLWSREPIVYIPGYGCEARFTARFTSPVANSLQMAGLFSSVDGLFFGFNGESFGVMHRYHGAIEVRTLTVTAGSGGAATVTVTLNGVAYTASITSGTATQNAHEIEVGLNAGAAANLWYIQHFGETVVFVAKNAVAMAGAFSVSVSNGTFAGTIAQNTAGVAPTESWVYQDNWNVDKCSWLDKTKGNLYKVEFAYLGYGPLKYYVFNPSTLSWELCHVIVWPNANNGTNLGNPSMRVGWVAASMGSTTNLTVRGSSAMAAIQGAGLKASTFGAYGVASNVTTETQVLTIQIRREFKGKACNGAVEPKVLSISTDSTRGAIFRLLINPTVAGTTAHTYVDQNNSVCAFETAGTTVSGGRLIGVYSVGPSGRATINLSGIAERLIAGDELVISALVTSGAAAEMTASIVWDEII